MHDKTTVAIRFGGALHDFTLVMRYLRLSDVLQARARNNSLSRLEIKVRLVIYYAKGHVPRMRTIKIKNWTLYDGLTIMIKLLEETARIVFYDSELIMKSLEIHIVEIF